MRQNRWLSRYLSVLLLGCAIDNAHADTTQVYRGLCDASAAVRLDREHFIVADDERNTLMVYQRGRKAAVGSIDVSTFLGTKQDKESDLEGAAAVGKRVYWISSHGRNSSGERQDRRLRFFATLIKPGAVPTVVPVGTAYTSLLDDATRAPRLAKYGLADASKLAPEAAGGLNIEGLAATPDGRLLIGFRNPLVGTRALVVTLDNPDEVVMEGRPARFGQASELDLGGRGIRSLEAFGTGYLIVAGPTGDDGTFALYRWAGGDSEAQQVAHVAFADMNPEAFFVDPGSGDVTVLSDDGGRSIDGSRCKDLPKGRQSFRSTVVHP